ncbi:sigma-54 interaction domain-containing protein [Sporomusa acidovorans]|uniref:Anaerobic nitric oxide reductase transcription regulator NorR n=1 Tax=Sporomusa acidovorans (strain ATCC 49682 / DSM 3132 / Mol) TaxID=1123286 RepID=A0ABZ3JAG4_SPOA4|nr:sigma 54-interacting transcriptional regulator [Sporomusa acidovorans]OZC16206.1 limonene hydroxylase [Sporomusa acidovorans DSM 3132]SDE31269.1 Transcriptional regulator containing PAS, AAA-type ATPase, and DNA-binding Fis domains [Sporomusa acidovorans]
MPQKSNFPMQQEISQKSNSKDKVIFVTDQKGNLLLSNTKASITIGVPMEQLLHLNMRELIRNGNINTSYTLQAAKNRRVEQGLVTTKFKSELLAVSTPILDNNKVLYLLTFCVPTPSQNLARLSTPDLKSKSISANRFRGLALCPENIVAESDAMKAILRIAYTASQTDSPVILYGESGTGKEVLAQYIHRQSNRSKGAFIAINCATLSESLAEAELFGYEKGAFTGAQAQGKIGLIEAAAGGTLFLDEIAELPQALQAKLLRVLEAGEIRRLGSCVNRTIDFRLIAATNKNLKQMTEEGTFRSDLFYRLNVINIVLPPLRERPEDITMLAMKFLRDFNSKYNLSVNLDIDTLTAFYRYDWPGNVRELRNEVEKYVISNIQDTPQLFLEAMSGMAKNISQPEYAKFLGAQAPLKETMRQFEEQYINSVLKVCNFQMSKAADRLGICRTVLYRKIKAYSIARNPRKHASQTQKQNQP